MEKWVNPHVISFDKSQLTPLIKARAESYGSWTLKEIWEKKNGEYTGLVTLPDGSVEYATVSCAESIYGTVIVAIFGVIWYYNYYEVRFYQ